MTAPSTTTPASTTAACEAACPLHDRRSFLSKAFLASVGAVLLDACGDGQIGVTGPQAGALPEPLVVTLSAFPALAAVGGIARVDGGGSRPIAVVRTATDTYVAVTMICTHAGYRPIEIVSGRFICPNHGAEFSATGGWTGGQRTSDLRQYTVALDTVAGTITIT
ncbi:MAG: Rieske (2Fe-2S) protein [Gemmatimonadaceae bacterium]|nr:Rieske (2Fe-2S) protein [Gemmatimonadaceae bacterium]